jgi:16S rRNA (guanine527-N7)-methyltransferase
VNDSRASLGDSEVLSLLEPYEVARDVKLADQIRRYMSLLLKWNGRVNITRISEPTAVVERHFGESLFAVRRVPIENGRLVDIGSGAGFPGLAIKLGVPHLSVKLIEANIKKCTFLREVVRELNLQDVDVVHARFEDVATSETANFITSRAVGNFSNFMDWCALHAASSGKCVLWVGEAGVKQIKRCGRWNCAEPVLIPQSRERYLLICSNVGASD